MDRIVFLIPHFGPWPAWIDHFIESCRANHSIDWVLFSDAAPPANSAKNVRHHRLSFPDYKRLVSDALGIRFDPAAPYKLCDIRPALPFIHADLARGYDFAGFGDIDVIYGDLRVFLDPATLSACDVLSTHTDRISGHFCLMRNTPEVATAFKRAGSWREQMERTQYAAFDEQGFYRVFRPSRSDLIGRWRERPFRCLFREAYSTPAATQGMRWFWENGRLTNEFYPHQPHMYLHFMSWHSNRWFESQAHVAPGAPAPWSRLERVVRADWRRARSDGFMISPDGIEDIVRPSYP